LTTTYKIYPMYLGEIPDHKRTNFTYLHNQLVLCRAPFISFLLKGSNGKNILVDTGPCDEKFAEKYHMPIIAPEELNIVKVLKEKFGLVPEDIDYIINTHLHWDHCSNNHLFPGKKIYVQETEVHYAMNPLEIYRKSYESPQTGLVSNWLKAVNQLEMVNGDIVIDDGIELIFLPGHSAGMQGVLIDTEKGKYLLGADLVNCYEQIEGDGVFPFIIPGLHTSVEDCFDSFHKIQKLMSEENITVIPGHDEKVLGQTVYPVEARKDKEIK